MAQRNCDPPAQRTIPGSKTWTATYAPTKAAINHLRKPLRAVVDLIGLSPAGGPVVVVKRGLPDQRSTSYGSAAIGPSLAQTGEANNDPLGKNSKPERWMRREGAC